MNSTAFPMIDFQKSLDPDYGLLVSRLDAMVALGVTEHGLRKLQPLLTQDVDFIRLPGQGAIERIFYSTTGMIKLCDGIASAQTQQLKTQLMNYLPQQNPAVAPPSPSPHSALVPSPSQPFTMPGRGEFDPYAPAQRTVAPSHIVASPSSGNYLAPPHPGMEHAADPAAAMVAQQLAPYLAPAVATQVAQQIMPQVHGAIARVQERERQQPPELTQAQMLFEQQKISLQQLQEMQVMILGAQQSGMEQAMSIMDVAKPQTLLIKGGGFEDLIALMRSEGFQMLVAVVVFAFALVALFGFLGRSPAPSSQPVPTTAPVAPIAPQPVAPVAPVPPAPVAPTAPATPVPGYYYPPTTPQ